MIEYLSIIKFAIGLLYKNVWILLWRVSDCEELVGVVNYKTEIGTDYFSLKKGRKT